MQQYIRHVRLSVNGGQFVAESDGNGLCIRFQVEQAVRGTPAHAIIDVLNTSGQTNVRFTSKQYTQVELAAGYRSHGGNPPTIFRGEIIQARVSRESITDTVLQLLARSSDTARNFATVNKALASGHTMDDRVQIAVEAFKKQGVMPGVIESLGKTKFPRNYVATGMAHDLLREICIGRQAKWWVHDEKLNIVRDNSALPNGVIVLNSATGLVGIPEQTIEGVQFNALLNPSIVPGCRVKIDNKSITQAHFNPSFAAEGSNQLYLDPNTLGLNADGLYKVLKVAHQGNTRGNEYYTHGWCVGIGADNRALRQQGVYDDVNVGIPDSFPVEGGGKGNG